MNLFKRLMHAAPDDGAESGGGEPSAPQTPSENLRSTLDAAFKQHDAPAPSGEPKAGETPEQTSARVRDERGRFAEGGKVAKSSAEADAQARGETQPQKPAAAPVEGQKPAVEPQRPAIGAPQSWKPGAREHWASLPPDVQAEVARRENEVARFAQGTAQARQVAEHLQHMGQQFAPALQAEGVDVLTATQNLMGMVSRLRFGTPQERASTIVGLIKNYAVDIEALDSALVNSLGGQGGQPGQVPDPSQFRDPRVDQLLGSLQQAQVQRMQQTRETANRDVQTFAQGKDFFEDVREDMADVLEFASRRGIDMTMEQAYERACKLNPDIDRIISQRGAAAAAQNPNGSTARARLASSSVRSTPSSAPNRGAKPVENLRDDVSAAWDSAESRGR